MDNKPKTINIDDVKYVRSDLVPDVAEVDGLKYVIVRSRDQGCMAGFLVKFTDHVVTLKMARQLYRWNSTFVLPELAKNGINKPEGCKFGEEMDAVVYIANWCGIIECTPHAMKSIRDHKAEKC